jgi:hypothetical protein
LRNKIPTLLVFSATAIALLLMSASPLVFSNNILLLQPVQATENVGFTSIQTHNPVALGNVCNVANAELTFDAQGTNGMTLTSGAFKITNSSNSSQIWWSGDFLSATPGGDTQDEEVILVYNVDNNGLVCGAGQQLWVDTYCHSGPPSPNIYLETDGPSIGGVNGNVDCESPSDTAAAQPSPSSSTTGTTTPTQDSDGDGIPDSSDRCTHNSNPRCFKEGDTTTQQPSSSNRTGNQTR